jgi:formamidopyrimidine-DNA glycosylase
MPELPEVEIVKRSLVKTINKAKIVDIKIQNKKLRYVISKDICKYLINQQITKISRRSKYLIFYFKTHFLLVHLGMTGKFLVMRKMDNKLFKTSFYYDLNILPKHNHIYFILNNGLSLIYNDIRKFGFIKCYKNSDLNKIMFLKKLGVEPLSNYSNNTYFKKKIKNKKKNIKNLLMDQTFVSGLGNIYVNEVLFLTKVNPTRVCSSLNIKEVNRLIFNIKSILRLSIAQGGSSIKDFKHTSGKSGKFQQFFAVYGKENKNCSRISCKGKIKKILISSRSSFFCNICQN